MVRPKMLTRVNGLDYVIGLSAALHFASPRWHRLCRVSLRHPVRFPGQAESRTEQRKLEPRAHAPTSSSGRACCYAPKISTSSRKEKKRKKTRPYSIGRPSFQFHLKILPHATVDSNVPILRCRRHCLHGCHVLGLRYRGTQLLGQTSHRS